MMQFMSTTNHLLLRQTLISKRAFNFEMLFDESRPGVANLSWTTGYFLDINLSGGALILKFATSRT